MLSTRAQHGQFINLLDRYENKLTRSLARAKNAFIKSAAASYVGHGGDVFHDDYIQLVETVRGILTDHYNTIVPKAGKIALQAIKSGPVLEKKDEESLFTQLSNQWIEENSLRNARLVASSTRSDVRNVIQSGMDEGLGTIEIARGISKVTMLSMYRSEVISRTETHNAATFGSIESVRAGAETVGVKVLKFWLPVLDERTRESHAEMANYPGIGLEEKFRVGGTFMDRPGDPAGGPAQVINCRCSLVYEEDKPEPSED